jgi:histone deacetylase complex regulatory component SIN3
MRKFTLIILIILLSSCKSANLSGMQNKTLESMVLQKLGEDAIVQKNKDATFALCYKKNMTTLSVSYLIIRLNDLTIVEQDNTVQASLAWVDTYKVEVRTTPGIVQKDEQSIPAKVIDVTKYRVKL